MLKIKDNVDLKKLEKFGFEKDKGEYFDTYKLNICERSDELDGFVIYSDDRIIKNYSTKSSNLDIIYNLIQANLVEKI